MIVTVLDGNGQPVNVLWNAQATPTDRSGTITDTLTSQEVMPATAARAGWLFQNVSLTGNAMLLSELGEDAAVAATWHLDPGDSFPPPGYPVPTGAITVAGTAGDAYTAREW